MPLAASDHQALRNAVRDIPDFPKPGILFKDITPLLANPVTFRMALDGFVERWKVEGVNKVVGIESRGFLFAAPLADRLGAGLVIVRKPGKLPYRTLKEQYELEYGFDSVHLHEDAIARGERALIVDDVIATGGTAAAVGRLVKRLGGQLVGYSFLIELAALKGTQKLEGAPTFALLHY